MASGGREGDSLEYIPAARYCFREPLAQAVAKVKSIYTEGPTLVSLGLFQHGCILKNMLHAGLGAFALKSIRFHARVNA